MSGEGRESANQRHHTYVEDGVTVGFFTDPVLCIGCKSCEVACKEWNQVPADGFDWAPRSYDQTARLGHSSWRHVLFLEEEARCGQQIAGPMTGTQEPAFRWTFLSDVCKHCEVAGCLEACPTGAIIRVENGAVYVQDDVCNGCGYCVVWCPFGVIDRRVRLPGEGGAFKCTFCYDRQKIGLTPACAKACPTESIQFGPLEELRERAARRVEQLREAGYQDARLYDPVETSVRGTHAIFITLGKPHFWRLPPRPVVPTEHLGPAWTAAAFASAGLVVAILLAFGLS